MLKKILIAFAVLVALVLVVGFVLPSTFRVERSTTINAPSEVVFSHVANLQRWREWSPWNTGNYPGTQWMTGGPEVGVDAVHSWSGSDVGSGTLALSQADPKTGVAYNMVLYQGHYVGHGRISFAPSDQGTQVTWVDEGSIGINPLKHYALLFLKPALGAKLEEALAGLKKHVEALPAGPEPEPTPAPVEQAAAPSRPPPSAQPAPPAVEGAPVATPPTEGTQTAAPAEGSSAVAPGETAPATAATPPPSGEPAPAAQGTAAPSGEPTPVQPAPSGESAPTPASAPAGASATPTQP